nr:Chain C, Insulin mimetic peptide S597 component 2 [synthetic construct]
SLEEEWAQIECEVYGRGCPS